MKNEDNVTKKQHKKKDKNKGRGAAGEKIRAKPKNEREQIPKLIPHPLLRAVINHLA